MPLMKAKRSPIPSSFDAQAFLDFAGVADSVVAYRRSEPVFEQGDVCDSVMYIQKGGVKLSMVSDAGREVVVAMLGPGEFFGEGCLAGQPLRMCSATALTPTAIFALKREKMLRLLHRRPELADLFITHMLGANIRIEEDLLRHLFDHDEQRLARTLLLLARYGIEEVPERVLPKVSSQKLAKLAGTTRSKVDFFMKKFKRLGFIDDRAGLTVNNSLLSVVLHE